MSDPQFEPGEPKLLVGDCRKQLAKMEAGSVHLVLTDPPYFLDGLDGDWKKGTSGPRGSGAIGGLPIGMKFDVAQGKRLQAFLTPINQQLFRVLKPGGFVLMFASPRLFHRTALAVEDAGFEIRDQYIWQFTKRAQFKAFTLDHFVQRRKDMTAQQKARVVKSLEGRRTPQLRPQFESILCAQKPRDGTFVDNWLAHKTGLIDVSQTLTGTVPSTVMPAEKPHKAQYNGHLTSKPLLLCEHLIRVFSREGQVVLDPFVGSGTTCVAALRTRRRSIGIDINPHYVQIAQTRIEEETK